MAEVKGKSPRLGYRGMTSFCWFDVDSGGRVVLCALALFSAYRAIVNNCLLQLEGFSTCLAI